MMPHDRPSEVDETVRRALELFASGFNCAESVLMALAERWGVPEENIPAVATAFGGGIASRGGPCGALTGALMAYGARGGRREAEDIETKKAVNEMAERFIDSFAREAGSWLCRDLIGLDLRRPEDKDRFKAEKVRETKCPRFVKAAVEIALSSGKQQGGIGVGLPEKISPGW